MMLNGIRRALFDAVGTLIYPHPPVAQVYHAAARQFGSQLKLDDIRDRFIAAFAANYNDGGATDEAREQWRWRSIVRKVIDDAPDVLDPLFDHLWQHFAQPRHWRLYDDVAPVLSELHRRDFKIGIASNFDARLKQIIAGHPPLAVCDTVFVSTEVGYSKPDLRFFRAIEKKLNLPAAEIALVGDDEISDVQAALTAGWRAIYLDRGSKQRAAIHSLLELIA